MLWLALEDDDSTAEREPLAFAVVVMMTYELRGFYLQ